MITVATVEEKRNEWLDAAANARRIAATVHQPGSGYGCPEALLQDEHRLETARVEADRLFREYHDLDRRRGEERMLELQQSQRLATWASFTVAAVVGLATVIDLIFKLIGK